MTAETNEKRAAAETLLETTKIRGDEELEYILYRESREGRASYSIQSLQYKRGVKVCQATACDVSSRAADAVKLFSLISESFVEPYVLCDVIYDLLP